MADDTELTAREREILLFENQWFKYQGAKAGLILEKWGLTTTSYYQLIHHIVDKPAAMAYDPLLVKRLLATRESRRPSTPSAS